MADYDPLNPATEARRARIEDARLSRDRDAEEWARFQYLVEEEKVRRVNEAQDVRAMHRAALEQRGLFGLLRSANPDIVHGSDIGRVGDIENALQAEFAGNLVRGEALAEGAGLRAQQKFRKQREDARLANMHATNSLINAGIKGGTAAGVGLGHLIQRYRKRDTPGIGPLPETEKIMAAIAPTPEATAANPLGFSVLGQQAASPALGLGNYASLLSNPYRLG